MHNLLEVKSRSELREWLRQNHDRETECWVAVRRGRPVDDGTFRYVDAVEEALCFGWIDSTVKKISDEVTVQKLCPRKPRSNWSELNKERCRRMERLGLMTDAGRAVLPDMSAAGFTIDPDILRELQADPVLWENFRRLPELYRRGGSIPFRSRGTNPNFSANASTSFWKTPAGESSTANGTTTAGYGRKILRWSRLY